MRRGTAILTMDTTGAIGTMGTRATGTHTPVARMGRGTTTTKLSPKLTRGS